MFRESCSEYFREFIQHLKFKVENDIWGTIQDGKKFRNPYAEVLLYLS